jgi:hypothetical protein
VNLEINCIGTDQVSKPTFYISLAMEKQLENFADSISTVTLHWANFDPLPYECKYFNCLLSTDGYVPTGAPYISVDLRDE